MLDYTKGEWYLEEETGLILSIPDGAESPTSIASIGGSQEPLTPKPLSEMLANAHLIAAAVNACVNLNPDNPMAVAESISDMYEALKNLRNIYDDLIKNSRPLDFWVKVDKALAKAGGK